MYASSPTASNSSADECAARAALLRACAFDERRATQLELQLARWRRLLHGDPEVVQRLKDDGRKLRASVTAAERELSELHASSRGASSSPAWS